MPTFDTAILLEHPELAGACALAGLAVALGVYMFARNVRDKAERATVDLHEKQRRMGRQAVRRKSGLLGVVTIFLPPFTLIARGLPMAASTRDTLAGKYSRAGWPGGLEDDQLSGVALLIGLVIAALVAMLALAIVPLAAPVALITLPLGSGILSGWLTRRAEIRDLEITRTMPFVLDLLVLTMRAGAPLNTALERVVIDYTGHPIGMEFGAVLTDMEMGVTKSAALESLAARNPIEAIQTFSDDLSQAEELGRPVADTLERLADRSRERRVLQATEMAGKAKVMVLVPGMLVFIATLILLFAPFAVRYYYGGFEGI